ncbi:hypothetical protein NXY46_15730 [Bacteroides ovatus]|uniref:hypothetical protein n=1 Tax=Bacteroides ovatus TaxID=28116 RepID=UPI0021653F57|nr:hypothetical protein [Bacteroides ovatus]MCS2298643.1 hypothetical protein [Bacteroides ovatus]MCS2562562.1 hypothetical protein [Bacteroides ovatus]
MKTFFLWTPKESESGVFDWDTIVPLNPKKPTATSKRQKGFCKEKSGKVTTILLDL